MDTATEPTTDTTVLRYAAFDSSGVGGNPAGVVLDASGLTEQRMREIAREVGYSETAFLTGDGTAHSPHRIRYFSPADEVAFCGHATIATAVAHAERYGTGALRLHTAADLVTVQTTATDSLIEARLTSPATSTREVDADALAGALRAFTLRTGDLDPTLPPRIAHAGNDHLVLALTGRHRLAELDYDWDTLHELMTSQGWTTAHIVWRESAGVFHARDPFPTGGVVEDPATGAAAAAFGGYLRELGIAQSGQRLTIHQGEDMGQPSTLLVDITPGTETGIQVSGTARQLPG